tara:strand:- start:476 stop:2875 length:2400 start_codon:yes stop_codon:yes gene_type:complete
MAQKRIYQIAKELNISHVEIIRFLSSKDIKVANHMAPVDNNIYDSILMEFSKEKASIDRQRKERARKEIISNKEDINDTKSPDSISSPEIPSSDAKAEPKVLVDEKNISEDKIENKDLGAAKKEESENINKIEIDNESNTKDDSVDKKVPDSPKSPKRKLKKIDMSAIADKINSNKKSKFKKAEIKSSSALPISKKSKKKTKKKRENEDSPEELTGSIIKVPEFTTVDELAQTMKVSSQDVIMKCMGLGLMVTINQRLDMDTIEMVADEFDFEVERLDIYSDDSIEEDSMDEGDLQSRPPVVTIMGHVDHGKTSLLDYIRDTNIIAGEAGGITQHIGAYEVKVKNGKKITFIDTPGHAAFTAMRARGAQVTDIVVLIVAADDGLKPQTLEAIDHAQAANVPLIVAINKIDLPAANSDNVKKQLSEKNILVEDWGGKYQSADISAKKGTGVDELLDKILIESEVLDLKANYECNAKAVIVESRLDKGLGPIATILVQHGKVKKGDIFLCGAQYSKIRELLNERNDKVITASPSDPVQVLGFKSVPNAGDLLQVYNDEREAKKIALQRSQLEREANFQRHSKLTLDQVGKNIKSGEMKELNIIIKGDVDGSIEALSDSLMELSNEEVNIKIVLKSAGMINQNDISLASASNAIIVAFNVSASVNSRKLAKSYGIEIRYYSVIYEAIDEIKLALEGLLDPDIVEDSIGRAIVKESFKIPKIGIISGSYVEEGKVIKNSLLRVLREGEIIYEGNLTSLKRFKDDVTEVKNGFECGIGVSGFYDFKENDVIEVYAKKEVKRTLK